MGPIARDQKGPPMDTEAVRSRLAGASVTDEGPFVRRLRDGDTAAFDELWQRFGAKLFAYAAARLGGDEFAWVLPRVAGRQAVERMARRHLRELHKPFAIDRRSVGLGVSAGIALYPDDGRDADTLMRHADSAMYGAKREGRGLAFYPTRKRHGD